MSDLFRSAFSYFSQAPPSSSHVLGKTDHPLVGSNVEVGPYRLKIRSLIAEGGYALVFSAQDSQGNWYALKRQLAADRDAATAVVREIEFLRSLSGHPAILKFVQATQVGPRSSSHGRNEYLMLTELCSGGNVVELLQKGPLTIPQVAKVFNAASRAVQHMHSKNPPVTHRDMKVENLLFDGTAHVKLCDFGSATTEIIRPDESWSASRRTQLEEELARFTTPMYRAPEVLDMYSNFVVGPPQDIWALGCILYYLCYRRHPFEDSAKLRILNAKYSLPEMDTGYNMFHPLIKGCLQIDPSHRLPIDAICDQIKSLAASFHIDLSQPVEGVDLPLIAVPGSDDFLAEDSLRRGGGDRFEQPKQAGREPPPRPPPSAMHRIDHERQEPTAQQQASAMFGAIKGQGMSWFKNIKDKTAAVAQTVQSTYGSRGPDVAYITSRLVIAPLSDAIPDALAAQAEEAMRGYVLERSEGRFAIYNLSQRRLRGDYSERLSEVPMPATSSGLAPTLKHVLGICRNMTLYLQQCATNFVIITGPETQCCLMAASLLMYGRLLTKPVYALQLIESKRTASVLPPSYHRVLDLLSTVVNSTPEEMRAMTHNKRVLLSSLLMAPPPKYNMARTGCRPIVDVFSGGNKLWSSRKAYEILRAYELPGCSTAEIDLENVLVAGDVQVVVYHARWSKVHGRIQEHFMFSLGFHANFVDPNTHILEMSSGDLDRYPDDEQKFAPHFRVGLRLQVDDNDQGFNDADLPAFLRFDIRSISQLLLVSNTEEFEAIAGMYGDNTRDMHVISPPEKLAEVKADRNCAPSGTTSDFFSTLSWDDESRLLAQSNHGRPLEDEGRLLAQPDHGLSWEDEGQLLARPDHSRSQSASPNVEMQRNEVRASPPVEPVVNKKRDVAEEYERLYGIRVGGDDVEDPDAELYKFDCEKETKKEPSLQAKPASEVQLDQIDLLGLDNDFPHSYSRKSNGRVAGNTAVDDLFDFSGGSLHAHTSSMHRNVSAPAFAAPIKPQAKPAFDPFADFLAAHPDPASASSNSKPAWNSGSGPNSGRATPNLQQKPNYARSHFDALSSIGGGKPKVSENTFDDLLSAHGFTSSKSQKSMSELRREEDNKQLDPVAIKMRDWTTGKERNIRALLGSLNDVLWPGADKWVQPGMAELLSAAQVKKYYRKACLVIHPDKQTGTKNEALARAIFTELNDAWTAFEEAGSPAL